MSNITKGLTEAFGRYDRRDAYQRDYDSSVAGMGKRQSQAYQADGGANDEGWDEPQRDYTPKPVAKKGFYFYKVPADQDAKAQEVGLFRTKSGKWYSPFQNTRADMFFGPGKYWEPKTNESQLSELSNDTLASYKKKAGDDATQADKRGDYARGDKRMSGIIKATKKEFDNDAKGVAEEKQRLDPSCWKGYKKQGTKMKGDTRVNNCVPVKESNSSILEGIQQVDEINWKHAAAAGAMALGALGGAGNAQAADLSGYNTQYLQQVVNGEAGRPMVSIDDAKQELQARMNGKQQRASSQDDTSNTPIAPKDYQTKEPLKKGSDGKWYNSAGEERDGLHGGPIKPGGGAMFRSLMSRQ